MIATVVNFPNCFLLTAAAMGLATANAFAHGDVHLRIVALTEQIAQSPNSPTNAPLIFQRADLYRVDGDWTNALADLDRVTQLNWNLNRVDFLRGLVHFEAGQPQAALAPLDRFLASKPKDPEAFTLRGRVLAKLNRPSAAIEDYNTAIALSGAASPELFIERAAAWRALGKNEEAIRGLDEGIRKLGPLVTLELPAVDAELALKHYDAALTRIDVVMARLQRKETWLERRAQILRAAGREEEARKNYRDALEAIERLPPGHRGTRTTLELEARLRAALTNDVRK